MAPLVSRAPPRQGPPEPASHGGRTVIGHIKRREEKQSFPLGRAKLTEKKDSEPRGPAAEPSDRDSWGLLVWLRSASAWGLGFHILAQPEGAAESKALGKVLGSVSP